MTKDILNPSNLKSKNCFKFNLWTLSAEFKGEICLMGVLKSELRWDWNEVSAFAMGHILGVKFSVLGKLSNHFPYERSAAEITAHTCLQNLPPCYPSPFEAQQKNWDWHSQPDVIEFPCLLHYILSGDGLEGFTLHRAVEENGRKMVWKCW